MLRENAVAYSKHAGSKKIIKILVRKLEEKESFW
jgi:hypothetical protein